MSYNLSVSNDSPFNFCNPKMFSADIIDYNNLMFDLPLDSSSSDYNLQALLNSNGNQQSQLENLSLYETTQFHSPSSGRNSDKGYQNFDSLNCFEVKNEESRVDFGSAYNDENVAKFSNQNPLDYLIESHNFQGQALKNSFKEEISAFKVGRYNQEERQERISKYRAKRNQRNFNKTIKYACRKTLADNRPRIRGRFARNDETVEIPKAACSTRDEEEDEYDLWALREVEDETMANGTCKNSFSLHQFQYHSHGCF